MLQILAKNPVFAANPACLADFVKTLVTSPVQEVPTPQPAVGTETTVPKTPDPAIEARKQYWSQFKRLRPSPSLPEPTPVEPATQQDSPDVEEREREALLSKRTLVLGEEDSDVVVEVVDSQVPPSSPLGEVAGKEPEVKTTDTSGGNDVIVDGSGTPSFQILDDRQRFPEEIGASPKPDTDSDHDALAPEIPVPTPAPAAEPAEVPEGQPTTVKVSEEKKVTEVPPLVVDPTKVFEENRVPEVPPPAVDPTKVSEEKHISKVSEEKKVPEVPASPVDPTKVPEEKKVPEVPAPAVDPTKVSEQEKVPESSALTVGEKSVAVDSSTVPQVEQPVVPTQDSIAEVLKRVNTVDLSNGMTPAPPQSLVTTACAPSNTVVMLEIGGVKQPVTVPLSPNQCALAGLEIVGAPKSLNTTVQDSGTHATKADQPEPPADESRDPSDKQMIKNLYMRFSRSQKRFLKAIC